MKSLISVNTPPPLQAAVAAVLLATGGSLEPVVAAKRVRYKAQRDAMLEALDRAFGDIPDAVSWNSPAGGFFLTVTLPFDFGHAELRRCASDHGVIVCPLQFFSLARRRTQQVRLSFSYVEPPQISTGIQRFNGFVRAHLPSAIASV